MIIYTSPEGYTLTSEDLSELLWMAGQYRKDNDQDTKTRAEHHADDVLWSLGWMVPSRMNRKFGTWVLVDADGALVARS